MYNNDYIIMVDENGQPYIAHGVIGDKARAAWGSVKGTGTKFLKKIKTSTGKWRYIYDPKELAAVGKRKLGIGGKKRIKEAEDRATKLGTSVRAGKNAVAYYNKQIEDGNRTKIGVRNAQQRVLNNTKAEYDQARADRRQAVQDYNTSLLGRAERGISSLKRSLTKYGNQKLSSIKDWAGYDERERRNQAHSAYISSQNKNSDSNERRIREETMRRADEEYSKTLLGRIETAQNKRKIRKNKKRS